MFSCENCTYNAADLGQFICEVDHGLSGDVLSRLDIFVVVGEQLFDKLCL